MDQTRKFLTKRICESIHPGEDINDAVVLRMDGIWKSCQINLHNIIVKNRETVLGYLPVEIGRGSTGIVLKATLRMNNKNIPDGKYIDVAVKLMIRPLQMKKMKADFIREGGILTDLSHPCIVQFMGLLLSRNEELKILLDAAEGFQYLHGERKAHMDIKPETVLVHLDNNGRINGHAKLADFGVSRNNRDTASISQSTVAVGCTLLYMAPEVMRNNAKLGSYVIMELWCAHVLPASSIRNST
jgi:serine/threonine protein kinase